MTLLASMQGGVLLTQTLRRTEPLETLTATLARVASFAADPAAAARAMRPDQALPGQALSNPPAFSRSSVARVPSRCRWPRISM